MVTTKPLDIDRDTIGSVSAKAYDHTKGESITPEVDFVYAFVQGIVQGFVWRGGGQDGAEDRAHHARADLQHREVRGVLLHLDTIGRETPQGPEPSRASPNCGLYTTESTGPKPSRIMQTYKYLAHT